MLLDEIEPAVDWLRGLGIEMSDRRRSSNMGGTGHLFDVLGYVNAWARLVEDNGVVLRKATVGRILLKDGALAAGIVVESDEETVVRCSHVLLATGDFQADPDLRASRSSRATSFARRRPSAVHGGILVDQDRTHYVDE